MEKNNFSGGSQQTGSVGLLETQVIFFLALSLFTEIPALKNINSVALKK